MVIVSMISAAIANTIGLVSGAIVPLVALCIMALLTVGKEAYCNGQDIKL